MLGISTRLSMITININGITFVNKKTQASRLNYKTELIYSASKKYIFLSMTALWDKKMDKDILS